MSEVFSIGDVEIQHGRISYVNETPSQPETRETKGNVTVVNAAREGSPAYFEVSFMITAPFDFSGVQQTNIFHWNCLVIDPDKNAGYRAVEARAFRQVVPKLRALADRLEADYPQIPEPSDDTPA